MESPDALQAKANALLAGGDTAGAAREFRRLALAFPADKKAVLTAAQGLRACRDPEGAAVVLEAALTRMPSSPAVLDGLAAAYLETGRHGEAAKILERLATELELKIHTAGRDPGAWTALGTVRARLARWPGAAAALRQAVALGPANAGTRVLLAQAELALGRLAAAEGELKQVLAIDAGHTRARTLLAEIESQAKIDPATLLRDARAADKANLHAPARAKYEALLRKEPGHVLAISRLLTMDGAEGRLDDAEVHWRMLTEALVKADLNRLDWRTLAAIAYQTIVRPQPRALYDAIVHALDRQLTALAGRPRRRSIRPAAGRRLKIGYLSAFLRDHPIGHVTAALFAAHDRTRFDVHVFSRPDGPPDRYTETIARGAEHFVPVSFAENRIAEVIAAFDLDILIHLDGYMDVTLLAVAARPAPIQIFWLGHAGSCEISAIDYVLADSTVVRPGEEPLYRTRVARLPEVYHCASPHAVAPPMSRAEAGLPANAFVFCAFNNPEKIDRLAFESWMRILARVEDSVLWLSQTSSPVAAENLRAEAAMLGIDGARLIFAPRLPDKARHLGRHSLCGLFLDTFILNASTVALDALWSGLPVLTLEGPRFGARIAATFLRSLGLEDMIVATRQAYEDRAVHLAANIAALDDVRGRLADARYTRPLFQTERFCRGLEATLTRIFQDHQVALGFH
ncbi:MAG: O-linked N-acetylglucosamine transferase, SPINDLY family protein [Rhodospirillaceae bacterium]